MKIIAHRGARGNAPENSMAAFLDAVRQGYGVECDIRLTKDNIPVIFHDASLKRILGYERFLADMNLAELEGFQMEGQHPIPTLESVIKHVLPETFINFNIKDDDAVQPTLHLLKGAEAKHGMLLSAHSIKAVSMLKANYSNTAFVHSWLPIAISGAMRSNTKTIVCRDWLANRLFISLLTKKDYEVYVWGKNPDAHRLRNSGASGLITDI